MGQRPDFTQTPLHHRSECLFVRPSALPLSQSNLCQQPVLTPALMLLYSFSLSRCLRARSDGPNAFCTLLRCRHCHRADHRLSASPGATSTTAAQGAIARSKPVWLLSTIVSRRPYLRPQATHATMRRCPGRYIATSAGPHLPWPIQWPSLVLLSTPPLLLFAPGLTTAHLRLRFALMGGHTSPWHCGRFAPTTPIASSVRCSAERCVYCCKRVVCCCAARTN